MPPTSSKTMNVLATLLAPSISVLAEIKESMFFVYSLFGDEDCILKVIHTLNVDNITFIYIECNTVDMSMRSNKRF